MPRIEVFVVPSDFELEAIIAPLDDFSREQGFKWRPEPIVLAVKAADGSIVGGAIGETNWDWLYIKVIALAEEYRAQGWGARLMLEIERQAFERGCKQAWVDTFSFQGARAFYEKLGYKIFGSLSDYPVGHDRYFLCKTLKVEKT